MTPSQEAKYLISQFYNEIGFYPQAKQCALIAVNEIIKSLNKNRQFTQCTIDLTHYEFVKTEIKALL